MINHNSKIEYRFANKTDVIQLAQLHYCASRIQPSSFMFKLGENFLRKYYKHVLEEKNSIILCALDSKGNIIGFVSGSLNNDERIKNLSSKKTSLFFSAMFQFIKNPTLIKEIISRYYSNSADKGDGYIVKDGPHEDFWAWRIDYVSGNQSIQLHLKWLKILKLLGIKFVRGEVDKTNKLILKLHIILGAKIIKEYSTPDDRNRVIIEYDLTKMEAE
jgi:hypothetical protein